MLIPLFLNVVFEFCCKRINAKAHTVMHIDAVVSSLACNGQANLQITSLK